MKTKACKMKLMADVKSATKNCAEPVKQTHATETDKNKLASQLFEHAL